MIKKKKKKKKNNGIVTVGYCLYQFIIYDPINLKYMYYVTVSLGCNKGCQIPILSLRCGLECNHNVSKNNDWPNLCCLILALHL